MVREIRMLVGYAAASAVAAITSIIGILYLFFGFEGLARVDFAFLLFWLWAIVGYSVIPSIVFAVVGELRGITSKIYYIMGALIASVCVVYFSDPSPFHAFPQLILVVIFSGCCAGFVYWQSAGRYAGSEPGAHTKI